MTGDVSSTVEATPPLLQLPQGPAPPYEQLINFPRAKSRGAAKHCVMCGRMSTGDVETATTSVIPKQNKDVCRECDKATWIHGASRTYFKWCKGCKVRNHCMLLLRYGLCHF